MTADHQGMPPITPTATTSAALHRHGRTPAKPVTAPLPTCFRCSWCWSAAADTWYAKYLSRSCEEHADVPLSPGGKLVVPVAPKLPALPAELPARESRLGKPLTEEEIEAVREMRQWGHSVKEISAELDIARATVARHTPDMANRTCARITDAQREQVLDLASRGSVQAKIAAMVGISPASVSSIILKAKAAGDVPERACEVCNGPLHATSTVEVCVRNPGCRTENKRRRTAKLAADGVEAAG